MNCTNCAAPLRVIQGQDHTTCDYCGTFTFLEEVVEVDEVLTGQAPTGCPVCREPLVRVQVARWRGWHCRACRGLLFDQKGFTEVVAYKRARAYGPPDPPQPLNRALLERVIYCPSCGSKMDTHPYYGPGNFVIDNCGGCSLVWLDYGELNKAVNGWGRDRKSDAALARWIIRLAEGEE